MIDIEPLTRPELKVLPDGEKRLTCDWLEALAGDLRKREALVSQGPEAFSSLIVGALIRSTMTGYWPADYDLAGKRGYLHGNDYHFFCTAQKIEPHDIATAMDCVAEVDEIGPCSNKCNLVFISLANPVVVSDRRSHQSYQRAKSYGFSDEALRLVNEAEIEIANFWTNDCPEAIRKAKNWVEVQFYRRLHHWIDSVAEMPRGCEHMSRKETFDLLTPWFFANSGWNINNRLEIPAEYAKRTGLDEYMPAAMQGEAIS